MEFNVAMPRPALSSDRSSLHRPVGKNRRTIAAHQQFVGQANIRNRPSSLLCMWICLILWAYLLAQKRGRDQTNGRRKEAACVGPNGSQGVNRTTLVTYCLAVRSAVLRSPRAPGDGVRFARGRSALAYLPQSWFFKGLGFAQRLGVMDRPFLARKVCHAGP